MQLPPAIFESALRDAEADAPFLAVGEAAFLKALRDECTRRGWVQRDLSDSDSWVLYEVDGCEYAVK